MAQPVTEIVYINLKTGIDFNSPRPESQVWKDTLLTLARQDGFVGQRYGRQLENQKVLMLLIGKLSFTLENLSCANFRRLDKSGQA